METRQQKKNYPFLQGGGEMGERIRNFDLSQTSIGPPNNWPQSLRISISNMLRTNFPMLVLWGDDFTCFYNDSVVPSLDPKRHPAIGKPAKEVWPEGWPFIGPLLEGVMANGEPVTFHDQPVAFYRNGKTEEVFWTFSYSLIMADDGGPGGVLVTCLERTEAVLAQKKLEAAHKKFASLVLHAPMAINIQKGQDMIVEMANEPSLEIWGKTAEEVIGKSLLDVLPELRSQGAQDIYRQVRETGKPYHAHEIPFTLVREGKEQVAYFNLILQPYYDDDNAEAIGMVTFATEVTAQVKARQYLVENEARFRNIIEQAPVAIALTRSEDFIFESINAPMLQLINRSKQDVLGRSLMEVLPELVSQPVFDILLKVLQTGDTFQGTEVEAELVKEGVLERRYFNITYSRIVDKDGVPSVLHMSADVTDQMLARRKTEESEAKLRSILNSAPTAMGVFVGPDLVVENPNHLLIEVMAAGPDIEGKSFRKLLSGLVEEDQKFLQLIDTVRTTGEPFEAQEVEVFFKAEKNSRYFNINFIPLYDESGVVYAVLDVSVDVTEQVLARKKMEEKETALEAALEQVRLSKEAAELGTFDMDLENGNMHWDKRCRTLFGISHNQPVSFDQDFIGRLHPDDQERVVEVVRRAYIKSLSNGKYDVEYRTIGAEDGVERWVRAKGKVYFNSNDKPVRFIGSVLDITEKVMAIQKIEGLVEERTKELAQVNESLLKANKELQRSNENLEEFAYVASHDLKEPIRKINFFTHQLKDELSTQLKERQTRAFNRIENATERMGNLIDDLLLYSHVSQRPPETEAVDLNEKLEQVLEDLDLEIEEKKATINIGTLPVIQGYRRQLQQLLQNLLSNALKYSKAEIPPGIEITAEEVQKAGKPYHLIKISDNGIGFPQEYADKIFQMFARLHGKSEYSGTGVGLSIVKKVVENHNGFVTVESEPGVGSSFHIYFPIL